MQSINKRIYFVLLEHDETGQCICMNEKKTVKLNISLLVCAEVFEWSPTTLSGNVHNSVCICRSLCSLCLLCYCSVLRRGGVLKIQSKIQTCSMQGCSWKPQLGAGRYTVCDFNVYSKKRSPKYFSTFAFEHKTVKTPVFHKQNKENFPKF